MHQTCSTFWVTEMKILLDLYSNQLMCVDSMSSFPQPSHVAFPLSVTSSLNTDQLFLYKPAALLSSIDFLFDCNKDLPYGLPLDYAHHKNVFQNDKCTKQDDSNGTACVSFTQFIFFHLSFINHQGKFSQSSSFSRG